MQQAPSKLRSFWHRQARAEAAAVEIDPADMGTCFGLEMSLGSTPPAADAQRPAEPRHWWERNGVRRAFGA